MLFFGIEFVALPQIFIDYEIHQISFFVFAIQL